MELGGIMSEEVKYTCGACGEQFSTGEAAALHSEGCIYVKIFTEIHKACMLGGYNGHQEEHQKIATIIRNRDIVEKYIRAVVYQTNSVARAALHQELCEKLYVDYMEFRPFEDSNILSTPSFEGALEWFVVKYMRSTRKGDRPLEWRKGVFAEFEKRSIEIQKMFSELEDK